jgi:hypothetical protein
MQEILKHQFESLWVSFCKRKLRSELPVMIQRSMADGCQSFSGICCLDFQESGDWKK